jgi:glycine cleavage system aminomethyltransferase T
LHLEEEVKSGALVKNPENSQPVGNVTSAITSPRFGPIALAVLKRPHDKAGTELVAEYGANSINATVSSLPFIH